MIGFDRDDAPRPWRRPRRRLLLTLLLAAATVLVGLDSSVGAGVLPQAVAAGSRGLYRELLLHLLGPPRVGIQIGHERALEHPEELARLRVNTGGHAAGIDEVEVNRAVARALARDLEAHGVVAELLPATVPVHYRADLVIAIHADSSLQSDRRGYKSATFRPMRNRREPLLKEAIDRAYLALSGLPDDDTNVSGAMLGYYAFNDRRYRHSVSRGTPAVIVELGYISHPADRRFLLDADRPAAALAAGIVDYLRERDRLRPP